MGNQESCKECLLYRSRKFLYPPINSNVVVNAKGIVYVGDTEDFLRPGRCEPYNSFLYKERIRLTSPDLSFIC